jgi:UDP-N-acetylglucosamine/UDP-N-acetylgalactosamine diphosphorylase
MSTPDPRLLQHSLEAAGQGHLWTHATRLAGAPREALLRRLASLDLPLIGELARLARSGSDGGATPRFEAPAVFGLDQRQSARANEAREAGEDLLARGKVGYLLVAGGQASRLGYEGPKGCFPIGPVTGRSLFEIFARRLHAVRRRHGVPTPWYIMTSEGNDATTREFFARHDHFGLPADEIVFFAQSMLPALDSEGRILMASASELFLAPNGHGGSLLALQTSGALRSAGERGVEVFSYFQVDNPLAPPADPLFLGLHALSGSQMSSKVVKKRDAHEKVGVLGKVDGRLSCIEYSDLPADLRHATDERGALLYSAGNIALHAIDRSFVERLVGARLELPWHVAKKQIPCIDSAGAATTTAGFKFETFVFDALAFADESAILEVERREEFSPVKNKEGDDSPATTRRDLCAMHARWVAEAGLALPRMDETGNVQIEIDPVYAESAREFAHRGPEHRHVRTERGTYYGEGWNP